MKDLKLILFSVMLNALAQLLLKYGLNLHGPLAFDIASLLALACNRWVVAGVIVFGVSVLVWMVVLSRVEVSLAYPMLGVGYVVNAFAAWALFAEPIGWQRAGGIALIVLGVYILTSDAPKKENA